jgi:hypothetical protein
MNGSEKLHDDECTVPTTMLVVYKSISFVPESYATCTIHITYLLHSCNSPGDSLQSQGPYTIFLMDA